MLLWATLRHLGRDWVADLVDRLIEVARALGDGVRELGGEVLNDVVNTQVCTAWGDDRTTEAVERELMSEVLTWMTGSIWRGRRVLRISVSNHATTDQDVQLVLAALGRAHQIARRAGG